jgi:hypothetical protein
MSVPMTKQCATDPVVSCLRCKGHQALCHDLVVVAVVVAVCDGGVDECF